MIYLDVKKVRKSYKLYNDQTYIGFLYRSDFDRLGINMGKFSAGTDGSPESGSSGVDSCQIQIDDDVYEKIKDTVIDRAFEKGVTYLADFERSAYDVSLKLRMKNFPEYAIEESVNLLYEYNYLNDRRFAESYIRSYMNSKSRNMLKKELSMRHIDFPDLDELLDEVYKDEGMEEQDAIEDLMRKKYGGQDLSDEKVKRRAVNFLLRHGFSFEQINNYLT